MTIFRRSPPPRPTHLPLPAPLLPLNFRRMDAESTPQVLELAKVSIGHSVFCTLWLPASPRFITLGSRPNATGSLQVHEVQGRDTECNCDITLTSACRSAALASPSLEDKHVAIGAFDGSLSLHDVQAVRSQSRGETWGVTAHSGIVNAVDACVGTAAGTGSPEVVTGGRDGAVRVWDLRQKGAPVATFVGSAEVNGGKSTDPNATGVRDCWSVAFGNSVSSEERVVAAGYDNGDIKLFDLRKGTVKHSINVHNGVCDLQFDRKDIAMNKLVGSCLESMVHVFDLRTLHPSKGYAQLEEQAPGNGTAWCARHLPQNRELMAVLAGSGDVYLYRYHYPDQRRVTDSEGKAVGVPGTLEKLTGKHIAEQPIGSLDWSPDKLGLAVCAAYDQAVRVLAVTKLDKIG